MTFYAKLYEFFHAFLTLTLSMTYKMPLLPIKKQEGTDTILSVLDC